ncbi:MAG: hypothetical protein H0X28_15345 [Solirubrobacterales bacterium]|nr:hypothetical protein [Solirubrobacterales bacterium]
MTLSIAIAAIVIADVVLLAGLAYVMSRAAKLTEHVSVSSAPVPEIVRPFERAAERESQRSRTRLAALGS